MAKKSKTTRQYNKQLQRQQKILRKAQQKGINLDLSSTRQQIQKPTKKDITRIRKQNIEHDRQVKDKTTNKNKLSLTNKQLQKAVQGRQKLTFKPAKIKPPKMNKPKEVQQHTPEPEEIVPDIEPDIEPEPEPYRPQEPTRPHPTEVNESTSFYTDSILRMYRQELKNFPNKAEPYITAWLDSLIAKYGRDDVAQMIQEGSASGVILTWEIAYDNSKLRNYVGEMLHYLPEMTPEMVSVILDEFDEWADIR